MSEPGAAHGFFLLKESLSLPVLHDRGSGSWFLETRLTLDLARSRCHKVRRVVRESSCLEPGDASVFATSHLLYV